MIDTPHKTIRHDESGIVLITVMVVMTLCIGIISVLLGHNYLSENRVIEQELVDIRVHWAKRGHLNYLLSRVRGHFENNDPKDRIGICNDGSAVGELPTAIESDCNDDNERIKKMFVFLNEIQTNTSKGIKVRNWSYGGKYHFNIHSTIEDDETKSSGRIKITSKIPNPTSGGDFGGLEIFDDYLPNLLINEICFSKDDVSCSSDSKHGYGYTYITKHYIQ